MTAGRLDRGACGCSLLGAAALMAMLGGVSCAGDLPGDELLSSAPDEEDEAQADAGPDVPTFFADDASVDGASDAAPGDGRARDAGSDLQAAANVPTLFSGCVEGSFKPYWGDVHAHSSSSADAAKKGAPNPAGAFKYARYTSKMNLLIITDHRPFLSDTEWNNCRSQANAANVDGTFVASCGFEMNQYSCSSTDPEHKALCLENHGNVFFPPGFFDDKDKYTSPSEFYSLIGKCSSCVGQYNHATPDEWLGFKASSNAAGKMRLLEFNGSGTAMKTFFTALNNGWLVAPSYNEDNHTGTYGDTGRRSGFFMPSPTRTNLSRAMRDRRTFVTSDKNASLRLMVGSCWMGSVLAGASATQTLPFYVEAKDKDTAETFDRIELYGPDASDVSVAKRLAKLVCSGTSTCSGTLSVTITPPTFVVARAWQKPETKADGTTKTDWLVSAPIWLRQ